MFPRSYAPAEMAILMFSISQRIYGVKNYSIVRKKNIKITLLAEGYSWM